MNDTTVKVTWHIGGQRTTRTTWVAAEGVAKGPAAIALRIATAWGIHPDDVVLDTVDGKAPQAPASTAWVHQGDDEPCDLFTVETASDLDRFICGHGQRVIEVYTEDHQEPVDPDTLFLTRAARLVVDAERTRKTDLLRYLRTVELWETLTALDRNDALAYAHRLATQGQEVTAHVAPF